MTDSPIMSEEFGKETVERLKTAKLLSERTI